MKDNKKGSIIIGSIVGASLVLSSVVIGAFAYMIRASDDVISVTGSARTSVTADKVKWVSNITRTAKESELKAGYAALSKDLTIVKTFLNDSKVPAGEVTVSPVNVYQNYDAQNRGLTEKEYNLSQTITINSTDVPLVTNLAKNVQAVVNQGAIFSTQELSYFYSELARLRVSLLSQAVTDARARAEKITENGGQKIGALKSASSGVVQVLPANSVDVSDYGNYDTSSIEKEVMVTVKATFKLK